jgi:hypothetical protein
MAALQRALQTARERLLSELEEQGLIKAFEFTHERRCTGSHALLCRRAASQSWLEKR